MYNMNFGCVVSLDKAGLIDVPCFGNLRLFEKGKTIILSVKQTILSYCRNSCVVILVDYDYG